ncbi:hypothetical protein C8R43DRAFT_1142026 [Mycena crocata]|nr:hypothetical protein C8R43DRAFT_1142026 [Mycena crocata]
MDTVELLKARLLVAQADKDKKTRKIAAGKENGRGKKAPVEDQKKKRRAPTVQWAKPAYHHLTDKLLTIIESKTRFKQGFGFDKGRPGSVDTGGAKLPDLCAAVARQLFDVDPEDEDSKYTEDDIPGLAEVVKNRINTIKKNYATHHDTLGATGHGLVVAGKEDEIIENSPIANAWQLIEKKFPWYKRMDKLMGTSPIVNRSAVAHSNTRVDLGVLDRNGDAHDGPISVQDSDSSSEDDRSKISGWESSSDAGRKAKDDDDNKSISVASSPPRPAAAKAPVTPASKFKTEPASISASARGAKRKSTHEHVAEIAAQDRSQRLKLMEVKEKGKTRRAQVKYDAKTSLEFARLRHQTEQAERQRQHDIFMMNRQVQLEEIRRGGPSPASQSYPPGGPAYGAPPPFAFDPSLQ